jgi:peroxisomal enoyl-CoA hydratase 2
MTDPSTPPSADDVSVGDDSPTVEETITRSDIVKYAGASGDFNRFHVDEVFAKEAGYESVFGHGMLTAGIASHVVADWVGLSNLESFTTRFTETVYPGDTITVQGEVVDKEETASGAIVDVDFEVQNQDDETVLTGSASARLPGRAD